MEKLKSCRKMKDMGVTAYDNGGKTIDRYTIILHDKREKTNYVIGMSDNPLSPAGFNQFFGMREELPKNLSHLGKRVNVNTLPNDVKKAICGRV